MTPIIALAGRPNTGKTTLFNALTGLRQRVANFPGCTVEKAVGVLQAQGAEIEIVDLPGTFSILPASSDEQVAFRFLSEAAAAGSPLRVLCVAEASNLENDLALALSLKACGYPVSLVVNMIDEAARNGIRIDREKLEKGIGMPVFMTCARSRDGIDAIASSMIRLGRLPPPSGAGGLDMRQASRERLGDIHRSSLRQAAEAASRAVSQPAGLLATISDSVALDRVLFHPALGPVILVCALFALFQSLFALGGPLRDALAAALAWFSQRLRPVLPSEFWASLLCDGIIAGISAVATFLPQIAILFALIGFLEASGYLPRAGAMVDRALRPFGLDGKVFIPFLSSFACAIPGVMASRTIPNEKRRLTAILLSPLMTCSARIPVYTLIISAFVPSSLKVLGFNAQGLVMAGMYAFGVLMALLLALALRATPLYEAHPCPVTLLPPYRFPKPRELARYVWIRCRHFLSRAGKVIFALSLALWTLASFPRNERACAPLHSEIAALRLEADSADKSGRIKALEGRIAALKIEHSLLGRLGRAVEPVFSPIGYDWKLSIAVISSLAAREVFVGTLGTLFALSGESGSSQEFVKALREAKTEAGLPRYTLATAVSLLLFFAIALQCVSTIVIVRRETGGWKWPALQFCAFFAIAYSLSWVGFHLTSVLIR